MAAPRPLLVIDMMALIGATAIGLWLSDALAGWANDQWCWAELAEHWQALALLARSPEVSWPGLIEFALYQVSLGLDAQMPIVAVVGPTVVALDRFGRGGPLVGAPTRPGAVAVAAATAGLAGLIAIMACAFALGRGPALPIYLEPGTALLATGWPVVVGLAVSSAWMLQLRRGWDVEAGWADRTGRLIGTYWLVMGLKNATLGAWFHTHEYYFHFF